jgi:hypothetical protein
LGGASLLCKQEVTGSIPVGSIEVPANHGFGSGMPIEDHRPDRQRAVLPVMTVVSSSTLMS